MKGFGYQDKILLDNREFNIHTGYNPQKNIALTEVFEKGNFIYSTTDYFHIRKKTDGEVDTTYLKTITKNLHNGVINEIDVLFAIYEKVKLLRQANPHYRLGKIFYKKNFFEEAIDNFERCIRLKPDHIRSYKLLGQIYLKLRLFREAAEIFKAALDIQPEYPDILNSLGVISTHLGEYEFAKDSIQQALKIKPDFLEANFNFGFVLFLSTLSDNPDNENIVLPARVVRAFKEIVDQEQYKTQEWQDNFTKVSDILVSGNKEKIISAFSDLQIKITTYEEININIDFFFLKFMYGGKELKREELDHYEKVIRDESDNQTKFADYWNELGVIHLIQCRNYFLKAMSEFEKSVKINPEYEAAQNSLEMTRHGKKGFLILLRAILK